MNAATPRDLVVLFADISGSTGLYERLGDSAAFTLIHDCLGRMEEEVYFHGGTVIKSIGDELLCTFPRVVSALAAATGMQQQVSAVTVPDGRSLELRVGMHCGPTLEEGGDVYGDAVNVAARVVELARAGQILLTQACFDQLPVLGRGRIRLIDNIGVKGRSSEVGIHEVMWRSGQALTTVVPNVARPARDGDTLVLRYADREIELRSGAKAFLIGRDPNCDLVVSATKASRRHASIETRRDKFVLVDRSTNGTILMPEGGRALYLKREECILQGSGTIGLGEVPKPGAPSLLHYACG